MERIPARILTNFVLAQHQSKPSKAHLAAAKYALCYLIRSKYRGIQFSSKQTHYVLSYVKFPVKQGQLTTITDANWGPQDQTTTKQQFRKQNELDPFVTRSFSGFIIYINGPVHWSA
eukprot:14569236-Ditylum_brightwellii.AAC.1